MPCHLFLLSRLLIVMISKLSFQFAFFTLLLSICLACLFKKHDAGACAPAKHKQTAVFLCSASCNFLSLHKIRVTSPTKSRTQKNMLMFCPTKAFMHLFCPLLFKAFSRTFTFLLYQAAVFGPNLPRGQSIKMPVYFAVPAKLFYFSLYFWCFAHSMRGITVSTITPTVHIASCYHYNQCDYLHVSLSSHAELPQRRPSEPHVLGWCGAA